MSRKLTTAGFLIWAATMMGLASPSCGTRLGPVTATQSAGSVDRPNLPNITVERAKECMQFDGGQLERGRNVFESTIELDEDGDKVGVTVGGELEAAYDLRACFRNALRDMPIVEQSLHDAVKILKFNRQHAGDSQEALERFLEVIPGVPIVESELVLEADGYSVVLPVTVKVVAKLEELIDVDEAVLKKAGQMALASLGYDEIMKRAEEQGWVKWVPIKQAQAAPNKQFLAKVPQPLNVNEVVKDSLKLVLTKTAPVAVAISQLDTPAPGPGDAVAVGIFFVSLVATGGISVYIYVTNKNAEVPTTSVGAPAPQPQQPPPPAPPPPPPPPRETCEAHSELKKVIRCDDPGISHYNDGSENKAYSTIVSSEGKGLSKEKSKKDAEGGPCKDRGGWHTNVVRGKYYVASIMGCNCCDDSSGKPIQKEKSRIRYH